MDIIFQIIVTQQIILYVKHQQRQLQQHIQQHIQQQIIAPPTTEPETILINGCRNNINCWNQCLNLYQTWIKDQTGYINNEIHFFSSQ